MSDVKRTIYAAYHALPERDRDEYLRRALAQITYIVLKKGRDTRQHIPADYLSAAWAKLGPPDARMFELPDGDAIRRMLVKQATYIFLQDIRETSKAQARSIAIDENSKELSEAETEACDQAELAMAGLNQLKARLSAGGSESDFYAGQVLSLILGDTSDKYLFKTKSNKKRPSHFRLRSKKIGADLGISSNAVSKIISHIRENAAALHQGEYFQFLEGFSDDTSDAPEGSK